MTSPRAEGKELDALHSRGHEIERVHEQDPKIARDKGTRFMRRWKLS